MLISYTDQMNSSFLNAVTFLNETKILELLVINILC